MLSAYSIRCGVLFICIRATPNAYYQINEQLHTFFFYTNRRIGAATATWTIVNQILSLCARLEQIVGTAYMLLCNKIAGNNIDIPNEASLQMQLGVMLKQIGQLYEFANNDHFSVALETWQDIEASEKSRKGRARCDISLQLTDGDETQEAAIEIKYFKRSKNEAVTDNRFALLLDLENLEHYKAKQPDLLCYEIVYTDNGNYTQTDNRSKIRITPIISGNKEPYAGRSITLQKSYSSIWDSYGNHHFLKIDLNQ